MSGYICVCTCIRSDGGLAGDAERSTSLVLATALCHAAMLCHAAANAIQRPRAVQHRRFALLRANGRSPAPRKRVQAFNTARCSVSGAGCTTLHRDQRLADRLRARRLVRAARCAALLRNKFSKLARLLNETIVRIRFPSLSAAARKRWCTSTTLRFLLDGSFCLISHDFNRACSCLRASLEVSSSKTRKASRTRHIGSVLRSVSGSCSTQCQRSAKVSKGAGGQVVQRCHRQSLENQAVQHCWWPCGSQRRGTSWGHLESEALEPKWHRNPEGPRNCWFRCPPFHLPFPRPLAASEASCKGLGVVHLP